MTEISDAAARYQRIALDYLRAHETGQSVLVISPGNDERRQLNQGIRKLLVEHGQIEKQGQEHAILVNRDLTSAQARHARSYQAGDVLRFTRGAEGVQKGSYLTVAAVDAANDSLTLHGRDGAQIEATPARWRGVQAYTWEHRTIAVGDRLEFRIHDVKHYIRNHAFATVLALDEHTATLQLGSRERQIDIPLAQLRHVDWGYAATSHAAQGATVDRVIVNADSLRSNQLVNREQFYVSVSRAKLDTHVYTDDIENLRHAVVREHVKEVALDSIQLQQSAPAKQQRQSQSMGMRI